MSHTIY